MNLTDRLVNRSEHILVKVACDVGATALAAVEQGDLLREHHLQVLRQYLDFLAHDQHLLVPHVADHVLADEGHLAVVLDLGLGILLAVHILVVEARWDVLWELELDSVHVVARLEDWLLACAQ